LNFISWIYFFSPLFLVSSPAGIFLTMHHFISPSTFRKYVLTTSLLDVFHLRSLFSFPTPSFQFNRFPWARSQSRDFSPCSYIFPHCLLFYPENEGSTIPRSLGKFLKDYTVSVSR
jgi:hypothetical protein